MHATEVIETYIDDTVRLLPKRQREDVANELRSLLNEELHARAEESGRPPDESLALSLVRAYGQPNEVAARYEPPWVIIDAADSTSFIRAAVIGACALTVLSALGRPRPSPPGSASNFVASSVLVWLGVLVLGFGTKSWVRRRRPANVLWKPRDRERANRVGAALVVPVAAFFVVFYGAPGWVLDQLSGGRMNTSWAAYSPDFQRVGLPCFLGLMVGNIAVLAFAAIQGRWRRLTRCISIGINLSLACLALALAVNGNVFQSSAVDQIARDVLAVVAAFYVPCVGIMIYGEIGRLDRAAAGKQV
jgi:hypothetical protein